MQKTRNRRTPLSLGDTARWSAYAAAGVAGAIGVTQSAEAAITVVNVGATVNGSPNGSSTTTSSGAVNQFFGATSAIASTTGGSVAIFANHRGNFLSSEGIASMTGIGGVSFEFAGFVAGFPYMSNLATGANISTQNFIPAQVVSTTSGGSVTFATATLAWRGGYGNDQFLGAGDSYFAFKFDNGGGTQYGWGRVTMSGANHNSYVFQEIAYGDVGEAVAVGDVPEPGSLGLLALGAVGLMGWRKRRGEAA